MALRKEFFLKSVDVDLETGVIHLKWLKRVVERVGDNDEVLLEIPHRRVIGKDDNAALEESIPDPSLRANIKKLARWTT